MESMEYALALNEKSVSKLNPPNIFGHRKPTPMQGALDAKREYNIKKREDRYLKKQEDISALRRIKRQEAEARKQALKSRDLKLSAERSAQSASAKKHVLEDEYLEKNREGAIARREAKWQHKMYNYISTLIDEYQEELDSDMELKRVLKSKKIAERQAASKAREERNARREMLDEAREDAINRGETIRRQKELAHAEDLRFEIEEEVEYKTECIENGLPTKVTMHDIGIPYHFFIS